MVAVVPEVAVRVCDPAFWNVLRAFAEAHERDTDQCALHSCAHASIRQATVDCMCNLLTSRLLKLCLLLHIAEHLPVDWLDCCEGEGGEGDRHSGGRGEGEGSG